MKFKKSSGFTLIELLVVVAIIGILSSIILVSLNTARNKGRDASAKGSMSSMRASAELYFDSRNSYGDDSQQIGSTPASPGDNIATAASICQYNEVVRLANGVFNQTLDDVSCDAQIGTGGSGVISYTLAVILNDQRTYCVDSTGYAGYINASTPGEAEQVGISCL